MAAWFVVDQDGFSPLLAVDIPVLAGDDGGPVLVDDGLFFWYKRHWVNNRQ